MSSALLVADLPLAAATTPQDDAVQVRAVESEDAATLAELYLSSYPPSVGARTLDDAVAEIDRTFNGAFGSLQLDLSLLAIAGHSPIGAVLTTAQHKRDLEIDAPFIIDLFVHSAHRQRGVGRLLLESLGARAWSADAAQLALRVNEGPSAGAHYLYTQLGFAPIPD